MGVVERGAGWRRRLAALALVLVMLLSAPAIADKVPPGWAQWDYWGRTRPLPVYMQVWSGDDSVCKRIVKALNGAGPSPASLYDDPIFLRWQVHPAYQKAGWDEPDKMFGEWIEAPFFNDGKSVMAFKLTTPSTRFLDEDLFVFDDLAYFRTLKRVSLPSLLNDRRVLHPLEPLMHERFQAFMALPKTMKDYRIWSREWFGDDVEINLAELNGKIYSVIRMPSLEIVLVLFFSPNREGRGVCLISPKKPIGHN